MVLWLDAAKHTLFRSVDQGKQWSQVEEVGTTEAVFLYEHPFDENKVFLTFCTTCVPF